MVSGLASHLGKKTDGGPKTTLFWTRHGVHPRVDPGLSEIVFNQRHETVGLEVGIPITINLVDFLSMDFQYRF